MISRIAGIFYNIHSRKNVNYLSNRPEQKKLRRYLEENKEPVCIICQRNHPPYILECAHIKPRTICSKNERLDIGVVNWMCRNCHRIYDKGDVGIFNGKLFKSEGILEYDFVDNFKTEEYFKSKKYFDYQYNNIFKN